MRKEARMREGIERELQDEKEEKHGVERAQVTEARLQIELQLELAGVEENKTIIKRKKRMKKTMRLMVVMMTIVFMAAMTASCDEGGDSSSSGQGSLTPDSSIPVMSDIKYELSPQAVIVPESVARQISDVDTLRQVITLPATGDMPEVGQVLIINTPTQQIPEGLLAKVKSVKETSQGYEVRYDHADLMEAFESIDIPEQYVPLNDRVEHIYDMDGNEVAYTRGDITRASGIQSIELKLPEKALGFDGIEITPKMSIDLLMRYVLQAADYEIDYAHCIIDGEITVGGDLTLKKYAESKLLEKYIPLVRITFVPITVGPVVITPWAQLNFIIKAEGAITLEASISYTRSVRADLHYQKGHGFSVDMKPLPEDPDALKYTFGPKFEGGFSYGLGAAVVAGVYGKTFAMGGSFNLLNKYTISTKLDLVALEGGIMDYLEACVFPVSTLKGSKWNFAKWEGFTLNQSAVLGFSGNLSVLFKDLKPFNVADINIPLDSSPIMPQVEIKEDDFYNLSENGKEVKLTLHHKQKSVLDDLTEFRAEFKPLSSGDNKKTIVKYFNFDDETRNWLKSEVKGKDVTTNVTVPIEEDESYDITVYMNVVGIDIPIFVGKTGEEEAEIRTDVRSLDISFSVHTAGFDNSDHKEGGDYYIYEDFQVSKSGKTLTITGKKRDSMFVGADNVTFSFTVDFSTPKAPVVTNFELQSNGYRTHGGHEDTNVDWSLKANYIPLEKIWNYGGTAENYVFRATEADGLKITSYSRYEEYYVTDENQGVWNFSLSSNPENIIGIIISYP